MSNTAKKKDVSLTNGEQRFADLIWAHEPIASMALVRLAEEVFTWKKSTTFTVLKTLCNKGLFRNENAVVTAILTKDEFLAVQSRQYVEDSFGGSLPQFLAAFMGGKKLSEHQTDELLWLINEHKEG